MASGANTGSMLHVSVYRDTGIERGASIVSMVHVSVNRDNVVWREVPRW